MTFAKEYKILIQILFSIEGYSAKDLVWEFPSKARNVGLVYKLLQKLWITGSFTIIAAVEDNAAPGQPITLTLFTNWYYAKVAKRVIIFAHCTK